MSEQRMFHKKVRDLEPATWSLGRREELGELRGVYHASQYTDQTIGIAIGLFIFGILYTFYPIFFLSLGILSATWPGLLWFVPGFLFIGPGVALLIPRRIYARWHISLWEKGFIYEKGSLCQVFRWDQIEYIQGSAGPIQNGITVFSYTIRHQDGYEVKLTNRFSGIAQFIDSILDSFSRAAAARELALIPPRDKLFSLNFKLDRQGISDRQGTTIGWQDIQELTIEKGTMAVLTYKSDVLPGEEEHLERL